jgi:hypothetical protein
LEHVIPRSCNSEWVFCAATVYDARL